MADELLMQMKLECEEKLGIRVYNVGLGDCIYVRVPDRNKKGINKDDKHVHILIDCGTKSESRDTLKWAIKNVEANLPENKDGKRVLDLLVVTHPHEDHHEGFEPDNFEKIRIKHLWLSPAFCEFEDKIGNKSGKEIQGLSTMKVVAQNGLTRLVSALPAGETREYLEDLLLSLFKSQARSVLNGWDKDGGNSKNKLDVQNRRYVSSDFSYEAKTQKDLSTLNEKTNTKAWKKFSKRDLKLFSDRNTKIEILGPTGNLDVYLPKSQKKGQSIGAMSNVDLHMVREIDSEQSQEGKVVAPRNISIQDFEVLHAGIQSNALAAVAEIGVIENNLSIVLLLEWNGYRLLFPGDAEWASPFDPNKANGGWNVMWKDHGKKLENIDFLKIGHHGSENATPWAPNIIENGKESVHPIAEMLDALLPESRKETARAVVSTKDTNIYPTIPDPILLREIGRRVSNKSNYGVYIRDVSKQDKEWEQMVQPWRTDRGIKDGPVDPPSAEGKSVKEKGPLPPDPPWIDIFFPA